MTLEVIWYRTDRAHIIFSLSAPSPLSLSPSSTPPPPHLPPFPPSISLSLSPSLAPSLFSRSLPPSLAPSLPPSFHSLSHPLAPTFYHSPSPSRTQHRGTWPTRFEPCPSASFRPRPPSVALVCARASRLSALAACPREPLVCAPGLVWSLCTGVFARSWLDERSVSSESVGVRGGAVEGPLKGAADLGRRALSRRMGVTRGGEWACRRDDPCGLSRE